MEDKEKYEFIRNVVQNHIDTYYIDTLIFNDVNDIFYKWYTYDDKICLAFIDMSYYVFYTGKKLRKRKLLINQLKLLGLREFS